MENTKRLTREQENEICLRSTGLSKLTMNEEQKKAFWAVGCDVFMLLREIDLLRAELKENLSLDYGQGFKKGYTYGFAEAKNEFKPRAQEYT